MMPSHRPAKKGVFPQQSGRDADAEIIRYLVGCNIKIRDSHVPLGNFFLPESDVPNQFQLNNVSIHPLYPAPH